MYWEKRKDRKGAVYYSFVYYDKKLKRNVRLRKEEIPCDITTDNQADEFCRLREAEHEAAKLRIKRKLQWKSKFYDFEKLVKIFELEIKKRAPNSWKNPLYFLNQYVLDFFLNHKQSNNLNNWYLYFDDFKDWLEVVKPSQRTKTNTLSYSSKNHAVSALNTFLDILHRKGKIAMAPKCKKFSAHLINKRSVDDVFTDQEIRLIYNNLKELDRTEVAADFFLVSINTGVRLGEGLGVSVADFFPGEPPDENLLRALSNHQIDVFGYIALESQLLDSRKPRKSKRVQRKPLKGRRVIKHGEGRVIPIMDKEVFNILARRVNQQMDLHDAKEFGEDFKNYLLFDGLNKNNFPSLLKKAFTNTKYRYKSPHCARHTFATNFAGKVFGDGVLCQLILGHKDLETTKGYVHLFEAINRKAKTREIKRSKIKLIS